MERRRELRETVRWGEAWETMNAENEFEGFEVAVVGHWGSQVVGIREGTDYMEHWVWGKKKNELCYTEKKF